MVSNINLLESRRRILLNTPHIETISDTIASFKTDVATKLKGCKVYFTPIQEGEGDPSPDNVRPIHGWDGITLYLSGSDTSNPTTLTIPFNRTIYGGYVDLVKGEVVEEIYGIVVDSETAWLSRGRLRYGYYGEVAFPYNGKNKNILAYSHGNIATRNTATANYQAKNSVAARPYYDTDITTSVRIVAPDTVASNDDFLEWIASAGPLSMTYELATPNTYSIDPQTLKALRGMNNIWSDANSNIEVSFYTH